jgi:hypothetical protein
VSCVSFLTPAQRAALAAAAAEPRRPLTQVLAEHPVPSVTTGTLVRLERLSTDRRPGIRASAAAHPHAPPMVLDRLAADPESEVRRAVAKNPVAPPVVLRLLAADGDPVVRGWVAANPSCPVDVLDVLDSDANATVRRVVAWTRAW